MDDVLAILLSDVHLSPRPPVARSAEGNWLEAMSRQLREVKALQKAHDCQVVAAGDIFDSWKPHLAPAELINFAIAELPACWGIPGQHDLPNHRLEDLRKSPFCTLMKAKVVRYLTPGQPAEINVKGTLLRLHGFPWGVEVRPRTKDGTGALCIDVAVIHAYIWKPGAGHAKAQEADLSKNWRKRLGGYDVAHFGDNHCTIHTCKNGLTIFNPGSFYRRHANEREHQPCVGLLRRDGMVDRHYLDVSNDKFLEPEQLATIDDSRQLDFEQVAQMFASLTDLAADFEAAVRWEVEQLGVSAVVKAAILKGFDKGGKR